LCGQIDLSKGVTCWRADGDGKPVYSFLDSKETGDIHFGGFSPDSKILAIVKPKTRTVELIDRESGKSVASLKSQNKLDRLHSSLGQQGFGKDDKKFGDLWSHDGKFFVLTDVEKEISLWNIETEKLILRRAAVWNTSYDWFVGTIPVDYEVFSFSNSHGYLLSRSTRNVRVFDPSNGTVIFEVNETAKKPEDGSFHRYISNWSPDGNSILTAADRNRTVILWTLSK
jgi:WD40 repeat protein